MVSLTYFCLVNYEETLSYLMEKLPMFQRIGPAAIKKDLTNTLLLSAATGHPHQYFSSIHIAGTNGKGSVSSMLAAILQSAGYTTGLYTSPHLLDFRERIRVNGVLCDTDFVVSFVDQHLDNIERIQPSFFEITVAMAFQYFREKKCDWAIIETGLGGRLDSTNIIRPAISVITNIGWDHMNMLGDSLEKIAIEKAGIIKSGIPVVIGEKHPETKGVFDQVAMEVKSNILYAEDTVMFQKVHHSLSEIKADVALQHGGPLSNLQIALSGSYQESNIRTTLATVDLLLQMEVVDMADIRKGLSNVQSLTGMRGRMEWLSDKPKVLADCAHNKPGIEALFHDIALMQYNSLHVVFGAVSDKDIKPVLEHLPKAARYYFAKPDIPRGKDANELWLEAKSLHLEGQPFHSVADAFHMAMSNSDIDDLILICGSIFVVAEVLPLFPMKANIK